MLYQKKRFTTKKDNIKAIFTLYSTNSKISAVVFLKLVNKILPDAVVPLQPYQRWVLVLLLTKKIFIIKHGFYKMAALISLWYDTSNVSIFLIATCHELITDFTKRY